LDLFIYLFITHAENKGKTVLVNAIKAFGGSRGAAPLMLELET